LCSFLYIIRLLTILTLFGIQDKTELTHLSRNGSSNWKPSKKLMVI
jgi:hypothetical protein